MNLRKEKLAELLVEKLSALSINKGDLVVINLPKSLASHGSVIGEEIVTALRANSLDNDVLLLPEATTLQAISEKDMRELGWIRHDKSTRRNSSLCRLQRSRESQNVSDYLTEEDKIWEREALKQLKERIKNRTDTDSRYTID